MLIPTSQFCSIVGISADRLEQRRLRERSAMDIAHAMGDDLVRMPITPLEKGSAEHYDALDATRLRAVIILEKAGVQFGAICRLMLAVSPAVMFPDGCDIFGASWLDADGKVRRIIGTRLELARATPELPLASITINISAVRDEVGQRALALLGLRIVGCDFQEVAA